MKSLTFLLASLLLFLYLLTVGGHYVAARWWSLVANSPSWYLQWWEGKLSGVLQLTTWLVFPALLYTLMQFRYLREFLQHE